MRRQSRLCRPENVFMPVYFVIDGRARKFKCPCGSRDFRVGEERDGQTELTCADNKRHQVLSGFYLSPPPETLEPEEPAWLGKVLRGVQLPLRLNGKPIRYGVEQPSRWTKGDRE